MELVVDKRFRPNIEELVCSLKGMYAFDAHAALQPVRVWDFNVRGIPIGVPEGNCGALWRGNRFNARGETVGMVVTCKETRSVLLEKAEYYLGIVTKRALESVEDEVDLFVDEATTRCIPPTDKKAVLFALESINKMIAPPVL